ncbi:hypothetical protein [Gorillibacterium massiliense]|uniref:hypothetical protein n=1 Tax=Gorillibacterium massiliense TaxID=1280390 RepID=UPI0004B6E23F|nr:hypothetical protein [Gorillibacterium massiliense]
MKQTSLIFLFILLVVAGCVNEKATSVTSGAMLLSSSNKPANVLEATGSPDLKQTETPDPLPPLPDTIKLTFRPLQLESLQPGKSDSAWKRLKSVPFGTDMQGEMTLTLYEESKDDVYFPKQWNGVLQDKRRSYLIRDLSYSFGQAGANQEPPNVIVFNRFISGQERYKLIGAIEMNANGPGLYLLIVEDAKSGELAGFEEWGTPGFIDLDGDGADEFIVEFQGLHLSWPDLLLIRPENGNLVAASVLQSVRRNHEDLAVLNRISKPPVIDISNIMSEHEPVYEYSYRNGILTLTK